MALYRYKESNLIDCVEVTSPRFGVTHATITATKKAGGAELEDLRTKLGAFDYSTLMDTKNGVSSIQIRGIKDEKSFIANMEKLDLAHNGIEKDLTVVAEKPPSFSERVRGSSLFLSALFYNAGNIAFIISGIQRGRHNANGKFTSKDWSEIGTGVAFSVGDLLMTFLGGTKGDEELAAVSQGLKKHLHQKGIKIPEGNELNPDTLHQSGLFKATDRWLRKHIIHVKCLSELAGGLMTIHAATKQDENKQINKGKLAAGFLITTGWLSTFLLEKPPGYHILDGNKEHTNLASVMIDDPRAWIARPAGISNNIANLWGSLNKWDGERVRLQKSADALVVDNKDVPPLYAKDPVKYATLHPEGPPGAAERTQKFLDAQRRQHDYIWNVVSACSFMVGHLLFGLSGTKGPKETDDDKSMMNDLVLLSANVLAKQPEKVREAAIEETSEYVSNLKHVSLSKTEVAEALRGKITELTHSTWAARLQSNPETTQHVRT